MRFGRTIRIIKLALLTLLVLLSRRSRAQVGKSGPFDLDAGSRVLAPVVYKQVAILPIVRRAGAPVDTHKYLTLAEGLKSKQVKVSETVGGGDVNHVVVKNNSDRPLFLLGGQLILGGQQDRILGKDTVLAPREVATLEVYCVEHGRWSGSREFSSAGGLANGKMRVKAKYARDQGAVWAEVANKQSALGGQNSTGTYRTLAVGEAGKKAAQPYRAHIVAALDQLPQAKSMVGFVAAVNGRVTAIEVFANAGLFAANRDALLDSVFLTAADVPVARDAQQAPSSDSVREFMQKADKEKDEDALSTHAADTRQRRGKGVVRSTVMPKNAPASAAPLYNSYQADE